MDSTLTDDINVKCQPGVEGRFMWPIRIGSVLIFAGTLAVNYVFGMENAKVSDIFHLWVTPMGMFFIIWAVIYSTLAIACLFNLFTNRWNIKAHAYFTASNILNAAWILVFTISTGPAVYASSLILILIVPAILLTWVNLGKSEMTLWMYITRNIFAFQLGWVIAAANLNLGMDIVYWWGADKYTQGIIFWCMAPSMAVLATILNTCMEGKKGLLSCFCLWLSVAWAFAGAGITFNRCLNGNTNDLC